jgi:FkbM family methyltransferase
MFLAFTNDKPYQKVSYSQEGEDLLLDIYMGYPTEGTYVDVGAHHPHKFSNSFFYYKKGIRGVCIDPIPGTKSFFEAHRPEDVFLNIGVSENQGNMPYFILNDTALNTFSEECLSTRKSQGYILVDKKNIPIEPLSKILDNHLNKSLKLLFFTIDVEGMEMSVLRSNDWDKYRPEFILSHLKSREVEDVMKSAMTNYLKSKGYFLCAKSYNSLLYKKSMR